MQTITKTEEKKTVQIDETTKRKILQYARFKRVEKALSDKIEKAKASILFDLGNVECVALFEEMKLASVTEGSRMTIDAKKLEENFPLVFKEVAKQGKPYLTLRTH